MHEMRKRLDAWNWRVFTLSFEISSDMYSFSYAFKKRFPQNRAGSIPIGMPIFCLSSEFVNDKIAVLYKMF